MVEDFNNLENQATKPWTKELDDSKEINFQVFSELGINNMGIFEKKDDSKNFNFYELGINNNINIFENKDEKIDSLFSFDVGSNFLNKKKEQYRKY